MNDHAYHVINNNIEDVSNVFERTAMLTAKLIKLRGFLLALRSIANRPINQHGPEFEVQRIQEAKTSLDSATKIALTTLFSLTTTAFDIGNSRILVQGHMENERSKVKLDMVERTFHVLKDSIYDTVRHSYLQNIHEDMNDLCQRNGVFIDVNQGHIFGI